MLLLTVSRHPALHHSVFSVAGAVMSADSCLQDSCLTADCLPGRCAICGERSLYVSELSPAEAAASVMLFTSMCGRHWSNCAQGIARSHGLTLLREQEYYDAQYDRALERGGIDGRHAGHSLSR